jgi:hypothetical protein
VYKYNDQFARVWSKQVFENNGRREIIHLDVLQDAILVFVSEYNSREGVTITSYYEYDLAGQVLAHNVELHRDPHQHRGLKRFRFERSLNRRHLVAFIEQARTNEPEELTYYVFSSTTDTLLSGQLTLPYSDEEFSLRKVQLSNRRQLFLLGRVTERGAPVNDRASAKHVLLGHRLGETTLQEWVLEPDSGALTDVMFKVDRNDQLVAGGFWGARGLNSIVGVYYARIDPNGGFLATRSERFPPDVLTRYLTARQVQRGRELTDFYLNHLILRSDGGLLVLAEQYYVSSTSYRDLYGFWYTRDQHHYDDVLAMSLDSTGHTEWLSSVPKTQSGEYTRELSYTHFVTPDALLILSKTRLPTFGSNVYYQLVGYDGSVSQPKPFFRRLRPTDTFYREASGQVSNTEGIVVYFQQRGRLFSLLKIRFG